MDQVNQINQDVSIVAYYFHNRGRRLRCFPKAMEWNGRRINFTETGMVHPTKKGQRMLHIFDMTDGNADYRLEFDAAALTWTLVSIADISETQTDAPRFAHPIAA
ncbi:MAG TPA: hypothetical protein VG964_01200 [Candidatus Saccharimonadales bacterium]|nr:hypothetical protein [Candidatus Saccharimonadales bacterium]